MDDFDCEGCGGCTPAPAQRLRWWDIAPVLLALPAAVLRVTSTWASSTVLLLVDDAAARDAEAERARQPLVAVTL
jgi:hypothetical protein